MTKLMIIPSVPVWELQDGLFFDRKFYDGFIVYCREWEGSVHLVIRIADTTPPEFGLVKFAKNDFPAEVTIIEKNEKLTNKHIRGADVILTSGDNHKNLHLSAMCKQMGIKCIYLIEYIIGTRLQIIAMSNVGIWQKLKSSVWAVFMEVRRRKAFRLADGLQANGMPAYNAYKKLTSNTLLYFDSRNSANMYITESELEARLSYLDKTSPLRLGFSGRLIAMKGADSLVEIAYILQKMGVSCTFDIFGSGDIAPILQQKIMEYKLEKVVFLWGNVDFSKKLIPFVKANLDLFICCHRQGDPSCTYIETYACGVPIVGYANKAHQGIIDQVDVGWSVPINDIKGLAEVISHLDQYRDEIKTKARNARDFSLEHIFEKTFYRRIVHCANVVGGLN